MDRFSQNRRSSPPQRDQQHGYANSPNDSSQTLQAGSSQNASPSIQPLSGDFNNPSMLSHHPSRISFGIGQGETKSVVRRNVATHPGIKLPISVYATEGPKVCVSFSLQPRHADRCSFMTSGCPVKTVYIILTQARLHWQGLNTITYSI
jgi:hypothetical protein